MAKEREHLIMLGAGLLGEGRRGQSIGSGE
jgi:hypothetical protein